MIVVMKTNRVSTARIDSGRSRFDRDKQTVSPGEPIILLVVV